MIQLTSYSRIMVAINAVDFRKGIDGLAGICLNQLDQDPFSGTIFVFKNYTQNAIKLLTYDGQGFYLFTKRLSKGKFKWWPTNSEVAAKIECRDLQTLLWNGNPIEANFSEDWKKTLV